MNQTPQDSESHIYISIQAENSFTSEAQILHSHTSQPTTPKTRINLYFLFLPIFTPVEQIIIIQSRNIYNFLLNTHKIQDLLAWLSRWQKTY